MGLNISRGAYQKKYSSDRISSLIGNGLLVFINSKTNWILVLSCDLPLINEGCLKFIWDSKKKGVDAVVPIVKDQVQPLCSLYDIDILSQLNYSINKQNFSLHNFLKTINTQFINMDHYEKSFLNMNTQNDLKRVQIKNKI